MSNLRISPFYRVCCRFCHAINFFWNNGRISVPVIAKNHSWPQAHEMVSKHSIGGMGHYFPKDFNEDKYPEAFSECLSSLNVGGMVDADRVKNIYKHGTEWVKHNVLMPYERPAFLKSPLKWLKMTAEIKAYNAKTNLMLRLQKHPDVNTAAE